MSLSHQHVWWDWWFLLLGTKQKRSGVWCLNRVVMLKWDKCVILGDGAEQKKQKKCFYYCSVFIDNEGLGGSQWHTHCGHIYYGKILAPQNFFAPFCYNYNVVKCDW